MGLAVSQHLPTGPGAGYLGRDARLSRTRLARHYKPAEPSKGHTTVAENIETTIPDIVRQERDQRIPHGTAWTVGWWRYPGQRLHARIGPQGREPERIERARAAYEAKKVGVEGREQAISYQADQLPGLPK